MRGRRRGAGAELRLSAFQGIEASTLSSVGVEANTRMLMNCVQDVSNEVIM